MQINKYIDHTLLKAFATQEEIKKLCDEAKKLIRKMRKAIVSYTNFEEIKITNLIEN